MQSLVSFETVRLSRVDLHADWQGGWVPSPSDGLDKSPRRFIKPARVKWNAFTDGTTFTGSVFGSGSVLARIYNKSYQAKQKLDDAYFALLAAARTVALYQSANSCPWAETTYLWRITPLIPVAAPCLPAPSTRRDCRDRATAASAPEPQRLHSRGCD